MNVDTETANLYKSASPQMKDKLSLFMRLWLHELHSSDQDRLGKLMDVISENAEARGLTPETLKNLIA